MHLSNWQQWNWLAGFLGYTVLMTVLVVRKRYRKFPWFTFLLAQEIFQSIVLFEVHRFAGGRPYFYLYWAFEIFDSLVRVGVFFELTRITSRLLKETTSDRIRTLMNAIVIASAICAAVVINVHSSAYLLAAIALKISVCSSILGGVLVSFFILTTFFEGIRSRIHSQALAYGLFLYFGGKLLAQLGLLFGPARYFNFQTYTAPLYIICLFAWSILLWFDEPKRVLTEEMDRLHSTFAQIEQKQSRKPHVAITMTDVIGL